MIIPRVMGLILFLDIWMLNDGLMSTDLQNAVNLNTEKSCMNLDKHTIIRWISSIPDLFLTEAKIIISTFQKKTNIAENSDTNNM